MQDPGYEFEKVIIKFFGSPKTPIYFSGYFDRNNKFEARALLFSICVREININNDNYSEQEINELKQYERYLSNGQVEYNTLVKCIEFLQQL